MFIFTENEGCRQHHQGLQNFNLSLWMKTPINKFFFVQTVRQANEMTRNITQLEKALSEKEGFISLAHTRLGNRAQRIGIELCR